MRRKLKKLLSILTSRLVIIGLLILIQLAWFLILFLRLTQYATWINAGFVALSLLIELYIINKSGNPSYKILWLLFIGTFPVLGGLMYLLFGDKRPSRKMRRQLHHGRRVIGLRPEVGCSAAALPQRMAETSFYLESCGFPIYQNSKVDYYALADEAYPHLLEDLKRAKHYIFMEYFIVADGVMWDSIKAVLKEKAAAGVEVRFVYDDLGSVGCLPKQFRKELSDAGIHVMAFNPFRPALSAVMNNRNHRKITVIDGRVAYTGGMNLADEYINARVRFGYWKDAAIRLTGECVWSFTSMFLELWDYILKTESDYTFYRATSMEKHRLQEKIHADEKGFVQPYTDSPLDHEDVGENVYLNMISRAKKYLYIFTPYLIIGSEMRTALVNAAKSGVDVRLVVPGIPDKKLVYFLTQSNFPYLIKNGVKIYTYTPGFIHAKCFVSDDVQATVGTVNMDYRSLCLHFECGVWMYRTRAVLQVKEDALKTFAESHEVTLEEFQKKSFLVRTFMGALKLFAPLL